MTASINRDEWLRALAEAEGPTDQGAVTANEFGEITGIPRKTAADRLERLVGLGKASRTFKFTISRSGQRRRVTAYRLVPDAPKKRR